MTEKAQKADFRRKPQIFADSPILLEIPAFGGRRKPQKTADFRRKPKIFAENRRKPQIGLRHLRCVTFSSALDIFGGFCRRMTCVGKSAQKNPPWIDGVLKRLPKIGDHPKKVQSNPPKSEPIFGKGMRRSTFQ